jgi:hypothetical protein
MTPLHLRARLSALLAGHRHHSISISIRQIPGGEQVEVRHGMHPHVLARRLRILAERLEKGAA